MKHEKGVPIVQATVVHYSDEKRFGFAFLADGSRAFFHIDAFNPGVQLPCRGDFISGHVEPAGKRGPRFTKVLGVDPGTEASLQRVMQLDQRQSRGDPLRFFTGTVTTYAGNDEGEGYGFIESDGGEEAFLPQKTVKKSLIDPTRILAGTRVQYAIVDGPIARGRRPVAKKLWIINVACPVT